MFCPTCGANVPENQAFCMSCGAKMASAAAPQQQAPAAKAPSVKAAVSGDKMLAFRIAIVALALLSIIFIFSKGISVHPDDSDLNMVYEWDAYFEDMCDSGKGLPITFQVISVVLVVAAAAAIVLPMFMAQLAKIKLYYLIPAAVAALNLLLYVIMLIVGLAMFENGEYASVFPAYASWFYIADMIALILVSKKMNKESK